VTGFDVALEGVGAWLVASLRVTAMFAVAPITGDRSVPPRLRLALGLAVAAAMTPAGVAPIFSEGSALELAGAIAAELAMGLLLGFGASLAFSAFELLGEFVSVQGGLGAATAIDPSSGSASPVLSATLRVFALLIYLAIDGHHELLRAAALSFERLPPGQLPDPESFRALAALGASLFEIALRLAAPFAVAMLIANLAVGVLGRLVPQLNLMLLQLPATIALTLGMLALGASSLVAASRDQLEALGHAALLAVLGGA
jgi:flagellar biosynthetic protein FliR